ncbi:toll/interleukin-1 receptor domain-containing protein [Bradyrhizobium ontarionense]|uniref:Toll/interleukin-1 receptor domain-containing protein n=1 Tax=Bradyrhizobium ontarionense TaxID=2898149 RepID=A0ABY3RD98_9BRAD|nr:toll/interleukin-1 receptor domain-containing protein [Bradyrhizobium sp. A19]UFZ04920.1 toll/interleukin-1 receptor domain-containing protein [Bradyrhizobium sp. A19]
MALAPVAMAAAARSANDLGPYRPAGVFISYASEDHDVAQAVYQTMQALSETIFDRVRIFLDSKSIEASDEIRQDLRAGLRKSDFLVVLYTGQLKKSHGYTGWELGFFEALMDEEKKQGTGETSRRIIYLYCGETPPTGEGILGINMEVETDDLSGPRADYVAKSAQSVDDPDALARVMLDIAERAESRLPPPLNEDRDTLDRLRGKRRQKIATEIIPTLKGKLFDSMSMRVTRHSVEQRLIEFLLPKPPGDQAIGTIPDDTTLTPHSRALEIFGIAEPRETLKWGEFRKKMRVRDTLGASSILVAIEQAVVSAISSETPTDSDQILKSVDDEIFRVIVTRQLDYYNGQKLVHVYFIKKLSTRLLGDNATSSILGFINVAAKYRFIFVEPDSALSVDSFILEHEPAKILYKVRQLVRELLLIEEEARALKLDQVAAIRQYFGADGDHLKLAKQLQDTWYGARSQLMAAAEKILGTDLASPAFAAAAEQWIATLRSFRETSAQINSTVTVKALDNLKQSFAI